MKLDHVGLIWLRISNVDHRRNLEDIVFGSERLTGALFDRLTHHVHILEMNGDSFRLSSSHKRQMDKEGSKMT